MTVRAFSSITDQVTDRLRQGMMDGKWRETLPGRDRLADELGCSHWAVEKAMRRLAREGLLVSQGTGRRRRIVLEKGAARFRTLRVVILLYEETGGKASYMMDLLHRLRAAGHNAAFADTTMRDLRMDGKRIARYVEGTKADAWIVMAGSRDVLNWFAAQETPVFALFGRNTHSPVASISLKKSAALVDLADQLVDLGHERIVILAREERRTPTPAPLEQIFLDCLKDRGIATGSYNLPDWGDSPEEFHHILDALFRSTPPTALIVDQPALCMAVFQHLSGLGITVPDDLSLACTDQSEFFEWCDPGITHIAWDARRVINRVVRWAENIKSGKEDLRKTACNVRLALGGTIGPAGVGKESMPRRLNKLAK